MWHVIGEGIRMIRGSFEFTPMDYIGMDGQNAKGCLQLVVCRVFSLLSSYRSLDPAIDSGGG